MSKLIVPNNIIIIGATLYIDYVQYSYLRREYPYIMAAKTIQRFPRLKESIIIENIKNIKEHSAVFVLDKFYDLLIKEIEKLNYEKTIKNDKLIFNINGYYLTVKKISLFNKLDGTIYKNQVNIFKVFGTISELEELEDRLCYHALIVKILPTWYHIKIKDSEGEKILTDFANANTNIKVVPIPSVMGGLIEYLKSKKKTISFAESCTGGLVATKLTKKPGASEVFKGSIVSYANGIKESWLGVSKDVLEKYGAVSKECVSQMLDGIEKMANSDISVAISGIAGPTGETKTKKVGTVFIGVKNSNKKTIKEFHFSGDRNFIQEQAARVAIEMILYSEKDFFDFF